MLSCRVVFVEKFVFFLALHIPRENTSVPYEKRISSSTKMKIFGKEREIFDKCQIQSLKTVSEDQTTVVLLLSLCVQKNKYTVLSCLSPDFRAASQLDLSSDPPSLRNRLKLKQYDTQTLYIRELMFSRTVSSGNRVQPEKDLF